MEKISLEFENCYGIRSLKEDLDFSTGDSICIYAPNGVMKTSFAKTFKDFSQGFDSEDRIFKSRITKREITLGDGTELTPESVFVIEPYIEDFRSEKMSTLLVNKELRERHEKIHNELNDLKSILLGELKEIVGKGKKVDFEDEITKATLPNPDSKKIFTALVRVELEVLDGKAPLYSHVPFWTIFHDAVLKALEEPGIIEQIQLYIERYDDLIAQSNYFRKGIFNHYNAETIAKSLGDNGFFRAKHSLNLYSRETVKQKEVKSDDDLKEVIEGEKDKILGDEELSSTFKKLDDVLKKNKDVRAFREFLLNNQEIIPELKNLGALREKLWISYLKSAEEAYSNLVEKYKVAQKELREISEAAKKEISDWVEVIGIFNSRFSVPFVLEVDNQEDVVLSGDVPVLKFDFFEPTESTRVDQNELVNVLSNGEKRALYILNIIFEVQGRRKLSQPSLFVIDDIADSFDYKNKYAIIEYLSEIDSDPLFKQIIMTHNFDFFRTVQSRIIGSRGRAKMTSKSDSETKLIEVEYLRPFDHFRNKLDNPKILVACISFVRNLVEYSRGQESDMYKTLTSVLHVKENSASLKYKDLRVIFEAMLPGTNVPQGDDEKKIFDLIFEVADKILTEDITTVSLESKIALSIAIRLKAEMLMHGKIADTERVKGIEKNQTIEMYKILREESPNEVVLLEVLNRVNLMTPENIHFNAFMYEPILDMDINHLKRLYSDISSIGDGPSDLAQSA